MTTMHQPEANQWVDHGDAAALFPVEDLPARVLQHRDAQVELEGVDSDTILGIGPTGLASSYFLHNHPLTAVDIATLPDHVEESISRNSEVTVSDFEVIRIGTGQRDIPNRSLAEF